MSNKKWTPGPWFANDSHPQHACYYIGPKDYAPLEVAIVYSPGQGKADADAHLIAASPDLYAALEVVLNDLERGFTPTLHLPRIRAAIARARGEQP